MIPVVNEQMISCRVYIGGMKKIVPPKRKKERKKKDKERVYGSLYKIFAPYAHHMPSTLLNSICHQACMCFHDGLEQISAYG